MNKTKHGGSRTGAGRRSQRIKSLPPGLQVLAEPFKLGLIPDFADLLNHKQGHAVLELMYEVLLSHGAKRRISAAELKKVTGHKFYKFYKSMFTCTDTGPSVGCRKRTQYTVQPHVLQSLASKLGTEISLLAAASRRGWDFNDSPAPRHELPRTNHRVYPWWAMLKREIRSELFLQTHGKGFDYDVRACKQTLLYQEIQNRSKALGLPKLQLPLWCSYAASPDQLRKEFMHLLGIDLVTAKFVVQTILNSGVAGDKRTALGARLGAEKSKQLRESSVYKQLRAEFKSFMKALRAVNKLDGTVSDTSKDGVLCASYYEALEDRLMSCLDGELRKKGLQKIWFVHDGFISVEELDLTFLKDVVKFELNWDVEFKKTCLTHWTDLLELESEPDEHELDQLSELD